LYRQARKLEIADLTLGELSTRGTVSKREKETEEATKVLGVEMRKNLNIGDGDIQNTNANRLKLIESIRKYKPEIVFAPYCF